MYEIIPIIYNFNPLSFVPKKGYQCVYMYTVCDKKYIGKTTQPLLKRHKNHIRSPKGCPVDRYLYYNEYKLDILYLSKAEDICKYEIYFIAKYDTIYPFGWNFTTGGDTPSISEEQKKHMSEQHRGKITPDETKHKLSESLKNRVFSAEHRQKLSQSSKGRPKSEEHKKKLSDANKGKKLSKDTIEKIRQQQYVIIQQYSLNGDFINEYKSIIQQSKDTGIDNSAISKCARGKRNHAGGYIWRYKNI